MWMSEVGDRQKAATVVPEMERAFPKETFLHYRTKIVVFLKKYSYMDSHSILTTVREVAGRDGLTTLEPRPSKLDWISHDLETRHSTVEWENALGTLCMWMEIPSQRLGLTTDT